MSKRKHHIESLPPQDAYSNAENNIPTSIYRAQYNVIIDNTINGENLVTNHYQPNIDLTPNIYKIVWKCNLCRKQFNVLWTCLTCNEIIIHRKNCIYTQNTINNGCILTPGFLGGCFSHIPSPLQRPLLPLVAKGEGDHKSKYQFSRIVATKEFLERMQSTNTLHLVFGYETILESIECHEHQFFSNAQSSTVAIFKQFSDRFLLLEKIGSGSFGTVFRVLDRKAGRHVAVKIFVQDFCITDVFREFELLRSFSYDDQVHGMPFAERLLIRGNSAVAIVMPLYAGEPQTMNYLDMFNSLRMRWDRDLMLIIWNRYAIMLFVALKRMHELGISHTDLSMRNIAFYQSSIENRGFPNFSITLIDFGHALYTHKPLFGNNKVQYLTNKCYNHRGTPPFRSLDTILSIFPTGPKQDVFAAGMILYSMMMGQLDGDFRLNETQDHNLQLLTAMNKFYGSENINKIIRDYKLVRDTSIDKCLPKYSKEYVSYFLNLPTTHTGLTVKQWAAMMSPRMIEAVQWPDHCFDFVARCLEISPYDRITASQAVEYLTANHLQPND